MVTSCTSTLLALCSLCNNNLCARLCCCGFVLSMINTPGLFYTSLSSTSIGSRDRWETHNGYSEGSEGCKELLFQKDFCDKFVYFKLMIFDIQLHASSFDIVMSWPPQTEASSTSYTSSSQISSIVNCAGEMGSAAAVDVWQYSSFSRKPQTSAIASWFLWATATTCTADCLSVWTVWRIDTLIVSIDLQHNAPFLRIKKIRAQSWV